MPIELYVVGSATVLWAVVLYIFLCFRFSSTVVEFCEEAGIEIGWLHTITVAFVVKSAVLFMGALVGQVFFYMINADVILLSFIVVSMLFSLFAYYLTKLVISSMVEGQLSEGIQISIWYSLK